MNIPAFRGDFPPVLERPAQGTGALWIIVPLIVIAFVAVPTIVLYVWLARTTTVSASAPATAVPAKSPSEVAPVASGAEPEAPAASASSEPSEPAPSVSPKPEPPKAPSKRPFDYR
jgi:hypothetical protein